MSIFFDIARGFKLFYFYPPHHHTSIHRLFFLLRLKDVYDATGFADFDSRDASRRIIPCPTMPIEMNPIITSWACVRPQAMTFSVLKYSIIKRAMPY
jgi:hypothetical protein